MRLTQCADWSLRHVLTESLKLKCLCKNIAFVLNDNTNNSLIGHNYAHLKSGAFSYIYIYMKGN